MSRKLDDWIETYFKYTEETESPKEIPIQKIDDKQFANMESAINATKDLPVDNLDPSEKTVIAKYNQVTIYKLIIPVK